MQYTTIRIDKKDLEFLERLRNKMRKRAVGDVLHSMVQLIRQQKSEEDLK